MNLDTRKEENKEELGLELSDDLLAQISGGGAKLACHPVKGGD